MKLAVFSGTSEGHALCRFLSARGARAVTLGPRILRTETAGMAMLAQTLYELEQAEG